VIHLPIVDRELRLSARRAGTHWGRVGAGAAAIGLAIWSVYTITGSPGSANRAGRATFITLALVATISTVATALRLTSPSIAAERREGTLGLLFLTDLKPYDVVFGKLAVTMLTTFYRALAVVPVFAIPMLMGGVTAGDVAQLTGVLMSMVFLAAAAGMLASTLSSNEKSASGLSWLLFLGILGAWPAAAALVAWLDGPRAIWNPLLLLSPVAAFFLLLGQGATGSGFIWVPLATGQLCAWGCLALACRIVPRVWQDRPATASQQTRNERFRVIVEGDSAARTERRRRMLAVNPVYWLNNRDRLVPWYPWIFLGAMAGLAAWATLKFDARWNEHRLVLSACWLLHLIFKTWVSSQSAHAFSADGDRGALELLLSTPLTTDELLRGHWLGLKRLFAAPIGLFLAVELVWIFHALARDTDTPEGGRVFWACTHAANIIVFLSDLWALGWVALWLGTRAKNGAESAWKAQFRLLTAPWLGVMGVTLALNLLFDFQSSFQWTVGLWVAISLPLAIVNGRRARAELHASLRGAALVRAAGERPAPPKWIIRAARGLAGMVTGRA
jgi:ABC-type Na+ efflux pump permease subunit